MPASELMILHGLSGGRTMAGKSSSYLSYDPVSGNYVRKTRRRRRSRTMTGGLGSLGSFGQATGLKGTIKSIQGVLLTGAIATAGAVITDKVYEKIGESLGLEGWKRELAKMATGIALGILIAKFAKKPRLAAAFAIGPIVLGGLNLFGDIMGGTSGLGMVAFNPVSNPYESMYAPLYGSLNTYTPVREEVSSTFLPQAPTLNGSYYAAEG